jgi:hypothetical protein
MTKQEWRDFHYPKPVNKKNTNYKLVDLNTKMTVIQGAYALCKWKKNQYPYPTSIVPVG